MTFSAFANRYMRVFVTLGIILLLVPFTLVAQVQRDSVPLKTWPAPLFWQPTAQERQATGAAEAFNSAANAVGADAATPAGSLVFVGMTPCRVVDTRNGSGFIGAFGPPSLS